MKSYLWTAALWLVLGVCALLPSAAAASAKEDDEKPDPEAKKQEVMDIQIKYCIYGVVGLGLSVCACWVLNNSNSRKKKYLDDLRKQDRLDPNEGMPLT